MSDYFLFNDNIEYDLLSGINYKDLNKKIISKKYSKRAKIWLEFVTHCKVNRKNLVILIGGASNSGKSSWSIELSKRLGIKNLIQTDTIRNNVRKNNIKDKTSLIHKSSYRCWEKYRNNFSKKAQIKGFIKQSKILMPYIDNLILDSSNNGQFTIIEGIHLIPSMIDLKKYKSTIFIELFFHVKDNKLALKRMLKRTKSNYLNRTPEKYLSHNESFNTLKLYLLDEAKNSKENKIIHNIDANKTLDSIFNFIYSEVNKVIKKTRSNLA